MDGFRRMGSLDESCPFGHMSSTFWRITAPVTLYLRGLRMPTYCVMVVGCADVGGASSAHDGLRKLSPSYRPA
jgi:hypothetical protein